MKSNTKQLTALAMCTALSYLVMVFGRIPVWGFLSFDPKDAVLALVVLLFGLAPGLMITFIVCLIEMITVSSTGILGMIMNFIASAAFIIPIGLLVKNNSSNNKTLIALVFSTIVMTAIMLLWNMLITPIYMNVPRSEVMGMLLPIILPFNLLKGFGNSALIFSFVPHLNRIREVIGIEIVTKKEEKNILSYIIALGLFLASIAIYFLILK